MDTTRKINDKKHHIQDLTLDYGQDLLGFYRKLAILNGYITTCEYLDENQSLKRVPSEIMTSIVRATKIITSFKT